MKPLDMEKATLRESIRARLKTIPAAARAVASAQLCARLAQEKIFANAKAILFFAPLPEEPDLWPLLEEALASGKMVALPRFSSAHRAYVAARVENLRSDVSIGQFNIREPGACCAEVPLSRLDLALVPGVAFDLPGRRLGRGKGFYDQLLAMVHGVKCGIAFDEQIVDAIPVGPLDIHLDYILTPTRRVVAKRDEVQSTKLKG